MMETTIKPLLNEGPEKRYVLILSHHYGKEAIDISIQNYDKDGIAQEPIKIGSFWIDDISGAIQGLSIAKR